MVNIMTLAYTPDTSNYSNNQLWVTTASAVAGTPYLYNWSILISSFDVNITSPLQIMKRTTPLARTIGEQADNISVLQEELRVLKNLLMATGTVDAKLFEANLKIPQVPLVRLKPRSKTTLSTSKYHAEMLAIEKQRLALEQKSLNQGGNHYDVGDPAFAELEKAHNISLGLLSREVSLASTEPVIIDSVPPSRPKKSGLVECKEESNASSAGLDSDLSRSIHIPREVLEKYAK